MLPWQNFNAAIEGTSGHVTSQGIEANQVIHKGDSLSITLS